MSKPNFSKRYSPALLQYLSAHQTQEGLKAKDVIHGVISSLNDNPEESRYKKAVSTSFYKLVNGGYATQVGHGMWKLTDSGCELAEAHRQGASVPPPRKGIDASPPKPPSLSETRVAGILSDVATHVDQDREIAQLRETLKKTQQAQVKLAQDVDVLRESTKQVVEELRASHKELEKAKLKRAIFEAGEASRQLQDKLQEFQTLHQTTVKALKANQEEIQALELTLGQDVEIEVGGDDGDGEDGEEEDPDIQTSSKCTKRQIEPPKEDLTSQNLTSHWFQTHLRPKPGQVESSLMRTIRAAVSRKCPISHSSEGKVDDHIQEFFCRMIHRDSLAKRIQEGKRIHYSQIASYAVRSAWSDARNDGTDPVAREIYGARTERERKENLPEVEWRGTAISNEVVKGYSEDETSSFFLDVVDGGLTPAERLLEQGEFDSLWEKVEGVMKATKPKAWERYANIARMKMLGYHTKEIAEEEGVSEYRAASMVQEAKNALRSAGPEYFISH